MNNREKFEQHYRANLAIMFKIMPEYYRWSSIKEIYTDEEYYQTQLDAVTERVIEACLEKRMLLTGPAIRRTCLELKIPCTDEGVYQYLTQEEQTCTPVAPNVQAAKQNVSTEAKNLPLRQECSPTQNAGSARNVITGLQPSKSL